MIFTNIDKIHDLFIIEALFDLYQDIKYYLHDLGDYKYEIETENETLIDLNKVLKLAKQKSDAAELIKYKKLRLKEYPEIGDQLDALYHYFESEGIENSFTIMIKEIKDKYPKTNSI